MLQEIQQVTWMNSPVLIALITSVATCVTIIWQSKKTRETAEREGSKASGERQAIGAEAAEAATKAAEIGVAAEIAAARAATLAATAAQIGMTTARVGQETHAIVNDQRTQMERLIADLRAEIAALRGEHRPSDAVLGVKPDSSDPEVQKRNA